MRSRLLGIGSKCLFYSSKISQFLWIPACLLKAYTKEQRHIKKLSRRYAPSDIGSVNRGPTFASDHLNSFKQSQLDDVRLETIENQNHPNYSPASRHDNLTKLIRPSKATLFESYKDANISLHSLSVKCSGCGSPLHCHDAGAPGFVSRNTYESLINAVDGQKLIRRGFARSLAPVVCVRCVVLREHLHELSTSFDAATYKDLVISHIQKEDNANVLIVADMLNLPHSLVPKLGNNFGSHKYILVGNKVDQLPVDGRGYADRWRKALTQACEEICGISESDISYVALISALTGFGVTELVDFLLSRRFNSVSPIYLVGSTNVGKSSLFNRLLLSDLCKTEAREAIHRATVSNWPGTTAGLLKFPTVRMNAAKRALREEARRKAQDASFSSSHVNNKSPTVFVPSTGFSYLKAKQVVTSGKHSYTALTEVLDKERNVPFDLTQMPTYTRSDASGGESAVQITASTADIEQLETQLLSSNVALDNSSWEGDRGNRLLTTLLDPRRFNDQTWCYDTPGLICPDQTLNYLPPLALHKLARYKSYSSSHRASVGEKGLLGEVGRLVIPRTFVMRPGLTLLLGQLGRLDLLQAPGPVYFTTFSLLPVHICEQTEVNAYVAEYASVLGPGPNSRLSESPGPCGTLPAFSGYELGPVMPESTLDRSSVDVVLSGAGWIGVVGLLSPEASQSVDGNAKSETNPAVVCTDASIREIFLRAWTPGGLGISLRKPALVPGAVKRRGRRMLLMREFSVKP
ncbi:nitric oxide-associated protein 1 [Paragonimus westermani]|uniref:Nitric oxide-associated protein 1 n=1 Tax=Paragonimus westermani TaxID=34504 RepID=A0A5J4NHB0_9TREM|nr:nitric oxide-associated protein 1 [Paragonimus westermani]